MRREKNNNQSHPANTGFSCWACGLQMHRCIYCAACQGGVLPLACFPGPQQPEGSAWHPSTSTTHFDSRLSTRSRSHCRAGHRPSIALTPHLSCHVVSPGNHESLQRLAPPAAAAAESKQAHTTSRGTMACTCGGRRMPHLHTQPRPVCSRCLPSMRPALLHTARTTGGAAAAGLLEQLQLACSLPETTCAARLHTHKAQPAHCAAGSGNIGVEEACGNAVLDAAAQ